MQFLMLIHCDGPMFASDCQGQLAKLVDEAARRIADGESIDNPGLKLCDREGHVIGTCQLHDE